MNLLVNEGIRIFVTNVKAVFLYGSETWGTTVTTTKRIQAFVNSCLRRILGAWWHETIKPSVMNGCGNVHVGCLGRAGDPTEALEMDWPYSPQASRQHYTTSLNQESCWKKEKRTTEKRIAPRSGSRRQRNWIQLETHRGIGSGPESLVESCWCPMPQKRRRRL